MKKAMVRVFLGITFFFGTFFSQLMAASQEDDRVVNSTRGPKKQESKDKAERTLYICPMHPTIHSEVPARCPECKMKLVKKEAPKATYTCSMHPEVKSATTGKCPKCKMKLVEKADRKEKVAKMK